jgi:hypothetical protein
MNKQFSFSGRSKLLAIVISVVTLIMVVGVAYAITITVDGTREAAWDGGGGVDDPSEVGITNDGVDIRRVEWTNNTNNFYFLFRTDTATDWNRAPDAPYIYLCINNDNNTMTGSTFPLVCLGSGYERYVRISGPTPLTVVVWDSAFSPVAATTSVATSGDTTELAVNVAALGLSSSNCGSMPTGIYMDGRTSDPDDNVLDTGDAPANCGFPTAITLSRLEAKADTQNNTAALILAASVVATLGLAGVVIRRRRTA